MKTTDNLKLNSPELSDAANVLKISENFEKLDKLFETLSVKKSKTAVSEFNSKCCMPYIRFINESEEDITVTDSSAEEETTFTVKAGESYVEWISEASVTPDYSFSAALDVNYFVLVADAIGSGGGGGGTSDYAELSNKPKINNVELSGNKSLSDIGAGTYSKPTTGIPKTDLSEAVQLSLGRADTALQTESHTGDYSKPAGGIPKTDLAEAVRNSLSLADTALQTEAHTGDYSKPSGGIPASDMTQSVQEALGKAHSHDNKSVLDGITSEKITQIGTNKSDISTIKTYINNGGSESKNGTTCTINVPENVSDFASIAMVGGKTEKVTPESGDPYLVSAPVEKIVSNGRNLLGYMESGTIYSDTGLDGAASNRTRSNYIEVIPGHTYSLSVNGNQFNLNGFFYDANKTFISKSTSVSFTAPTNSKYFRFYGEYGTSTSSDLKDAKIQIEEGSTATAYSAPFETELSLTDIVKNLPDYGASAGNVYNYIDFETGKYYHNVGSVDLGTLTWTAQSISTGASRGKGYTLLAKKTSELVVGNIICSDFDSIKTTETFTGEKEGIGMPINASGGEYFYLYPYKTAAELSGVMCYFELATPEVIDLADTLYPIECESGGTITFVNEHSLDVPNKVIYKKEV